MPTANERIVNGVKTRVLHNKNYVEVAERLRIVHELKKDFEVLVSEPYQLLDRVLWRVEVKVDGKTYKGNAEVKMNAPKNTPDGTNPFECAETSALGRVLAFAGLGTIESIASYEEIGRSQPFVAVVEQRHSGIVEAQNVHPQIDQGATPEPTLKQRLNTAYSAALRLNAFERGKDNQETMQNFLVWVSELLEITIKSPEQITSSRMDMIETFLVSKDAA